MHGTAARIQARTGPARDGLILELTESRLIDATRTALASLEHLRALGVRISVADFGTGHSSLAYLTKFPIGAVKIDRAFVEGIDEADAADATLVSTIVTMAEALGMYTVAEGVKTQEQAAVLTSLGCRFRQGYLYAAPMQAEELPSRVAELQRPVSVARLRSAARQEVRTQPRLVLQPHLWRGASGGVVAASGAGLVAAAPA